MNVKQTERLASLMREILQAHGDRLDSQRAPQSVILPFASLKRGRYRLLVGAIKRPSDANRLFA